MTERNYVRGGAPLCDLVGRVAAELDPDWRYAPTDDHGFRGCRIIGPQGASIAFYPGNRILATPVYPCDGERSMSAKQWGVIDHAAKDLQFTFDPSRRPAAIARELHRRVIALYLPLYAATLMLQAKRELERARMCALEQELTALPKFYGSMHRDPDCPTIRLRDVDTFHGEIQLSMYRGGCGTVHLRFVPPALIKAIARLVSDFAVNDLAGTKASVTAGRRLVTTTTQEQRQQ